MQRKYIALCHALDHIPNIVVLYKDIFPLMHDYSCMHNIKSIVIFIIINYNNANKMAHYIYGISFYLNLKQKNNISKKKKNILSY